MKKSVLDSSSSCLDAPEGLGALLGPLSGPTGHGNLDEPEVAVINSTKVTLVPTLPRASDSCRGRLAALLSELVILSRGLQSSLSDDSDGLDDHDGSRDGLADGRDGRDEWNASMTQKVP